ncbi:flagellar basal-body rod protein FlgG [Candidatus Marinamargulisbacteria bacterium SCGC AG-410-N11]|nr:flagellar basal-body rod protein FlgG [Candidatus Marinamargulisbacteria bacterium SCGC AG-410-N11]
MLSQLFMAKSAFFAFERKMQVVANNISNSQTVGYKKRRVEMESLFPLVLERTYSEFEDNVSGAGNKRKRFMEYGQGVRIVDITKDFSVGTIEVTNQQLDMAIQGKGMFQFRMPDGSFSYSRAGNFHIDPEGNLLSPNGHPLEPAIRVPRNVTEFIINEEGRVFVRVGDDAQPREVGQVMLAKFPNEGGIKAIGQNLFKETIASGQSELVIPGRDGVGNIKQRALEFSNVNIVEEMMEMLLTQRSFELIVKTIQSADSMLKIASDINK